ncbi:MAG: hypothetical protein ABFS38_17150 [Bacteroidota bacterium]
MKALYLIRRDLFRLFTVMLLLVMANSSCDMLSNPEDEGAEGVWREELLSGSIMVQTAGGGYSKFRWFGFRYMGCREKIARIAKILLVFCVGHDE